MLGAPQEQQWIGHRLPRREDARLLSGQGRFVDDLAPKDCLVLEFFLSPYAAGRITVLDIAVAARMPGVVAVLVAADLNLAARAVVNPLVPGVPLTPMEPLATTHVGAAGQAVAAIVATSSDAARDAADYIVFEVTGPSGQGGAQGATAAPPAHWGLSLPRMDHAVRAQVDHALVAPCALEPRAVLAVPETGGLTLWLSTQTPQRARDDLCAMLALPPVALRVIASDVGGAFGGKASLMPEDVVTACAALHLQRPVKWTATRSDEFLTATQGRGAQSHAELMVDDQGRATALWAGFDFPLGHWMPYSALAPIRNAGRILPGPYDIPHDVTATVRLTEGAAVNIYRGAGRPEAAAVMERLMDRAASRCGLDPMEIRRRNLTRSPVPGQDRPCSGDFAGMLDRLAAETDYAALRAGLADRRANGEVCGLGLALYVEPCGQGWETASLTLGADGHFLASTGSSAQGQGRETAMAQIVAQALGIFPDQVDVIHGDTATTPEGIGALASRSTAIGGAAMWRAALAMRSLVAKAAAPIVGCAPDKVGIHPTGVSGPLGALGWSVLARQNAEAPLRVDIRHEAEAEAWASGAILAEVTIDAETGVPRIDRITWVDDAGVVINPMLVQGQLIGGAAQGIGAALMERMVYQDGQLLTGSLMDYAVPRAADMPPIRLISQPTRSPANPLGVKGVGEAGCIGVPAALLNAVMDALPPDTPDLFFPLLPEKIWRALMG